MCPKDPELERAIATILQSLTWSRLSVLMPTTCPWLELWRNEGGEGARLGRAERCGDCDVDRVGARLIKSQVPRRSMPPSGSLSHCINSDLCVLWDDIDAARAS